MDFESARLDPAAYFGEPAEVCRETSLSRQQKVGILEQWAYDLREMGVAEEENMPGDNAGAALDQVLAALHQLDAFEHGGASSPTKQGGD